MVAYLYAACSIKSLPQEFPDDARRAPRFEQCRDAKRTMLRVAVEEMVHLHYVNSLLRALGERSEFSLPPRDAATGMFRIADWKGIVGDTAQRPRKKSPEDAALSYVGVPVTKCTEKAVFEFMKSESTGPMQQRWSPADMRQRAETIYDWETMLNCLSVTQRVRVNDASKSLESTSPNLGLARALYHVLVAHRDEVIGDGVGKRTRRGQPRTAATSSRASFCSADHVHPPREHNVADDSETGRAFPPVAELYMTRILPLYEHAEKEGWLRNDNRSLANETMSDGAHAGTGILVLQVYRGKRFSTMHETNFCSLMEYKTMLQEIAEEGEGFSDYDRQLDALFKTYPPTWKGVDKYFETSLAPSPDKKPSNKPPPYCPAHVNQRARALPIEEYRVLRHSHLYSFSSVLGFIRTEQRRDPSFEMHRKPLDLAAHPALRQLHATVAANFNVIYLCMTMWLGRTYDVDNWHADKARRQAIENLCTWPMMSMAVRPMLEIAAGFFEADVAAQLFRVGRDDGDAFLPADNAPVLALWQLLNVKPPPPDAAARQEWNIECDGLALKALTHQRIWVRSMVAAISSVPEAALPRESRQVIVVSLSSVESIGEFESLFPFRWAGGYCNFPPTDTTYLQLQEEATKAVYDYSEDFDRFGPSPLFHRTAVLRLRFQGGVLVPIATDPDPTFDPTGTSGGQRLVAADVVAGLPHLTPVITFHQRPFQTAHGTEGVQKGPPRALPPPSSVASERDARDSPGQSVAPVTPGVGVRVLVADLLMAGAARPLVGMHLMNVTTTPSRIPKIDDMAFPITFPEMPIATSSGARQHVSTDGLRRLPLDIDFEPVDGVWPQFYGRNCIVARFGEPLDPCRMVIRRVEDGAVLLRRQCKGPPFDRMTGLQRCYTGRFSRCMKVADMEMFPFSLPDWARRGLEEPWKTFDRDTTPGNRIAHSMLTRRSQLLLSAMRRLCEEGAPLRSNRDAVSLCSLAERLRNLDERLYTLWPGVTVDYAHTISGPQDDRGIADERSQLPPKVPPRKRQRHDTHAVTPSDVTSDATLGGEWATELADIFLATAGLRLSPAAGGATSLSTGSQQLAPADGVPNSIRRSNKGTNGAPTTTADGMPSPVDGTPNSSWALKYSFSSQDGDAMTCVMTGEVLIPVTIAALPFVWDAATAAAMPRRFHPMFEALHAEMSAPKRVVRLHRAWRCGGPEVASIVKQLVLSWTPWWAPATSVSEDATSRWFQSAPIWDDAEPTANVVGRTDTLVRRTRDAYLYRSTLTRPGTRAPMKLGVSQCYAMFRVVMEADAQAPPTAAASTGKSVLVLFAAVFEPTQAAEAYGGRGANPALMGTAIISLQMSQTANALGRFHASEVPL